MDIGFSMMFYTTISMSLKLREENQVLLSFESLMDDDSVVNAELSLLASNTRKEVMNVLEFFLSFLKVYDKRKSHNVISFILDPRYKNLCI
jgi:sensor histidine kinase YesM